MLDLAILSRCRALTHAFQAGGAAMERRSIRRNAFRSRAEKEPAMIPELFLLPAAPLAYDPDLQPLPLWLHVTLAGVGTVVAALVLALA